MRTPLCADVRSRRRPALAPPPRLSTASTAVLFSHTERETGEVAPQRRATGAPAAAASASAPAAAQVASSAARREEAPESEEGPQEEAKAVRCCLVLATAPLLPLQPLILATAANPGDGR